jgi:DNA-binding CsgD family transcriptional regulator
MLTKSPSHPDEGHIGPNQPMDPKSRQGEALAATLDTFAAGVIIVNDRNVILYANRAAVRMFATGRPVRSVNGCLSARDATAIDQLSKAIALARKREAKLRTGIGVALESTFGEPVIAHVFPLAYSDVGTRITSQATVAIFVMSAVAPSNGNLGAVARCLRLTPAETRILEQLAAGATLTEAAAALGIADTTARTHLTHIFSKTGVARQGDLIALIHRLLAPVLIPAVSSV